MTTPEFPQLADTFATIARELEAANGPAETREVVTRHAVEQIPGCTYAAISLIHRGGTISSAAATDDVANRVDQIQYETGEGPCLSAINDDIVLNLDNIADEQRWPKFVGRTIAETGIASMLAFRLFTADDITGSLNLYSTRPHAFDDHSRAVGTILAAHAAVALLAAVEVQTITHLEEALSTSRQIGAAIGIVMHSQTLSYDEAFDFLIDTSQRLNHKLRHVADVIVETGELPGALGSHRRT